MPHICSNHPWEKRRIPMNSEKITFVICANDEQALSEACRYIDHLEVPEGYYTDTIVIRDAKSMAEGYNRAMRYSDAKYKIYLHQDVMIVKKDFLSSLISVFNNPDIGMVGMVGCLELPPNGIMWNADRVGSLYSFAGFDLNEGCVSPGLNDVFYEVEAIDGFLMATQYDIPWREDLFDGFDFYDVSQSLEFIKAGYKVLVPAQDPPWVFHNCGLNNYRRYYKYRRVFVENYRECMQCFR